MFTYILLNIFLIYAICHISFYIYNIYIYRYINKCIHICLQMINYIPFLRKLKTIMKVSYRPSSYYKNGFSNITSKKCRSYGCPLRKKKLGFRTVPGYLPGASGHSFRHVWVEEEDIQCGAPKRSKFVYKPY